MMHWLTEPFQYEFMQRALLGSAIIGFTNGFLGAFIVLRRLALLADALSHSLLPGLALAAIFFGLAPVGLFFGALIATIFVGVGGQLIARSSRLKEDTAIGALFVFAFAIGVILLGYSKVRVDLSHFLFGNVLGISNSDLWISYGIGLVTMIFLAAQHRPLLLALFEPAVAATQGIRVGFLNIALMILTVLAMISSLQAVGVVLSLGLLILPSTILYLFSDSYDAMTWGGGILGAVGSILGLLLSYWVNIPSGPAIVLVLGIIFLLSYLFSPKYGVIPTRFRKRHLHEESLRRWDAKANPE